MQPKVSIIIPCYNKVEYISVMFDSILAQIWDNIELILVNDGSTDGTRGVIADYEQKFIQRGYDVIIVDQENKGLAGAVYSGLLHVTGDFVCQVDADDALDNEYITTLAGWLAANPDYDWAVCDYMYIKNNVVQYVKVLPNGTSDICDLKKWIFFRISNPNWVYLYRVDYLKKCSVIKNYYASSGASQEPQFYFPLALGGGKLKYFELPLYKRMQYLSENPSTHHSFRKNYEHAKQYWIGFANQLDEVIKRLDLSEKEKQRLSAAGQLSYCGKILADAEAFGCERDYQDAFNIYFDLVCKYFPSLVISQPPLSDALLFLTAVEDNVLSVIPRALPSLSGRVIAWGALGNHARPVLGYIKGTVLEPIELWDLRGDGEVVVPPNIESLQPADTVLILTKLPVNTAAIVKEIKDTGCQIITYNEIVTYMAAVKFPAFYDGSLVFD